MKVILIAVPLFRFVILLLLLLGAGQLCERNISFLRLLLAAGMGAIYTALCCLPACDFFGNLIWYYGVLCAVGLVCFGFSIKPLCVFVLINLVLDGLIKDGNNGLSIIPGVLSFIVLFFMKFKREHKTLLPVSLTHRGKTVSLYALRDTGNNLKDPITGLPVLVVSAKVAQELIGITEDQIKNPLDCIEKFPGLRLIPYSTVGHKSNLMLGLRLKEVRIGKWKGSRVVAFAPEGLDENSKYQALTGGSL